LADELRTRSTDFAQRYEGLRRNVVSESPDAGPSLGLALLIRQGTTAWMQAWLECTALPHTTVGSQPTLAQGSRAQVARVLIEMALGVCGEGQ